MYIFIAYPPPCPQGTMWSILRPYIDPWSIVFIVPIGTIKGPDPKFVA